MNYKSVTPAQLDERMKRGDELRLIDVRELEEYAVASVEGAQLLPLSQFSEWAGTLDPGEEIVVMCHHGIRSAQVCMLLSREGFTKLSNLSGGIDRWACEVDRSVPRY